MRARLLLVGAVLAVLFAGCLWQSRALLHFLNAPLAELPTTPGAQATGGQLPQALARSADAFSRLAHSSSLDPQEQGAVLSAADSLAAAKGPYAERRLVVMKRWLVVVERRRVLLGQRDQIDNFAFSPATLTVSGEGPIAVANNDNTAHTFTADDGHSFETGPIDTGASTSVTTPRSGRYPYHCTIHPFVHGTLVVR